MNEGRSGCYGTVVQADTCVTRNLAMAPEWPSYFKTLIIKMMNTTLKLRKNGIEDIPVEQFLENNKQTMNMVYRVFGLFLLLSWVIQYWIVTSDPSEGFIGPNIWLLALMALIFYMVIVALSWWLLQKFWMSLGLPELGNMVLQFKQLTLWQQLGFYWASFISLLLAAVWVLSAVL